MVSILGHCGVHFRWMESDLLRTQLCFSIGALWGAVQTDGLWSFQDLLGVQFWDIFGFITG